jgi:hypothetical protein
MSDISLLPDPPHSRASRLLQYQRRAQVFGTPRFLWETSEVTRAANAVCHSTSMSLTHRIRQQAGSYRINVVLNSYERRRPCGRRPRLRGQRTRSVIQHQCGCPTAFASKLTPTGSASCSILWNIAIPVGDVRGYEGSERGLSFTINVAAPPHSPASRLLQDQRRAQFFDTPQTLWETSEVTRAANAVCHSASMWLTHRIRQQAGSYSIGVVLNSYERRRPCGRRPRLRGQRMRCVIQHQCC